MEEEHYKYRRYKRRDNKYLLRVYLCIYGGLALAIFLHKVVGFMVCAFAVYYYFVWAYTERK
jgi:hypothetical protein